MKRRRKRGGRVDGRELGGRGERKDQEKVKPQAGRRAVLSGRKEVGPNLIHGGLSRARSRGGLPNPGKLPSTSQIPASWSRFSRPFNFGQTRLRGAGSKLITLRGRESRRSEEHKQAALRMRRGHAWATTTTGSQPPWILVVIVDTRARIIETTSTHHDGSRRAESCPRPGAKRSRRGLPLSSGRGLGARVPWPGAARPSSMVPRQQGHWASGLMGKTRIPCLHVSELQSRPTFQPPLPLCAFDSVPRGQRHQRPEGAASNFDSTRTLFPPPEICSQSRTRALQKNGGVASARRVGWLVLLVPSCFVQAAQAALLKFR